MRFRFFDGYQGSSFSELLTSQFPHLVPEFHGLEGAGQVPTAHGTTVIGLRWADGVLVAGDRMATMNYMVASRDIQKVYATDDYSLMAIAGAAGPAIEMARLLRVQFEHYEKIEGQPLELEGKANTLSSLIRQNLPAAMQGLVVVPIFAGYDRRRRVGRVWKYEVTGGRYEEQEYDSVGLRLALRPRVAEEALEGRREPRRRDRHGDRGADRRRRRRPRHGRRGRAARHLSDDQALHREGDRGRGGPGGGEHLRGADRAPPGRGGLAMVMPFYVSPEQMTQDKAEFARKGIARGKSLVTLEFEGGIALVAENPYDLNKIGEIYDRVAFAGVGKYSEFDRLRKIGVQWADVEGFRFSREDVRGKALAGLYSQVIGDEFIRSLKPLEVEIVVAEVGDDQLAGTEANSLYKIQFDGAILDLSRYCVIGGSADQITRHLESQFRPGLSEADAVRLGRDALQRAENGAPELPAENLEVCVLERRRTGRKFRRLDTDEIRRLL